MKRDFITLSCPNCGAALEITFDVDRFICLHCGTQQLVKRGGGIISLHPLVEGIARVQQGTDKTAAELAIRRLTEELTVAQAEAENALAATRDESAPVKVEVKASNLEALSLWGGIMALFMSLGLALQLSSESMAFCMLPLIAGIALLIIYIPLRLNRGKRLRIAKAEAEQAREKAQVARQEYANKKAEKVREIQAALERNRRIVNS